MSRASSSSVAGAVVLLVLVSVAFVVAPRACEGGFEIYLQCGVAALIVLAALPFVFRTGNSVAVRTVWGLGFVALGAAAWVLGLVVANVNFICRLF